MKNCKKSVKMLLSVVMTLVLVCGIFAGAKLIGLKAGAIEPKGEKVDGGDYWNYYKDGELVIGSSVPDIADAESIPWRLYLDNITIVSISDGVTSLGKNSLAGLKVRKLYIPKTVATISKDALGSSRSITTIYYGGSQSEWTSTGFSADYTINVVYNHTHTESSTPRHAKAANCSEAGYEGDYYCTVCDALCKNGDKDMPATNQHDFRGSYIIIEEATCQHGGLKAKKCLYCDACDLANSVPIAQKSHNYTEVVGKLDNPCDNKTTDQKIRLKCSYEGCEETKEFDVPKGSAHHYEYTVTEPNCAEQAKGYVTATCKYCNFSKAFNEKDWTHTPVVSKDQSVDPTCTEQGKEVTVCAVCGEVISEKIIPNLHTENYSAEYIYFKETDKPTCAHAGYKTLVCNECHQPIQKKNDAGEMVDIIKNEPKLDYHQNSVWFTIEPATCTKGGRRVQLCTVCAVDDYPACTHYSDNSIGLVVNKASDRTAIDEVVKVVKDEKVENYRPDIKDIAEDINIYLIQVYRDGTEPDAEQIKQIFIDAISAHGKLNEENDTFEYDVNEDWFTEADKDYYTFTDLMDGIGNVKGVLAEIIEQSEDGAVPFNPDAIVEIVERVWINLGVADTDAAVAANPGDTAELEKKVVAHEDMPALGHEFVRAMYVLDDEGNKVGVAQFDENDKYVPVSDTSSDPDVVAKYKYYKIIGYTYDEELELWVPEKGDEVTEGIAAKYLKCTEKGGEIVKQCVHCLTEFKITNISKAERHNYEAKTVAPSCEKAGYTESRCLDCDYVSIQEGDAALNHDFQETTLRVAKCTESGITVDQCTRCGMKDKSTYKTIKQLDHTNVPVKQDPTCLEPGFEGTECSVCGFRSVVEIDPLGHNYTENTVDPTCTEDGYTEKLCLRCGDSIKDGLLPRTGHTFGLVEETPASCGKPTTISRTCQKCGYVDIIDQKNDALSHSFKSVSAKAATCTEGGYTAYKECTICGEKQGYKEIPAKGHSWGTVPGKTPTCQATGFEAYNGCTICKIPADGVSIVTLDKIPHDYVNIPAVAPTCTKAGSTAGVQCTMCKTYTTKPEPVPAKGHDYKTNTVSPTCTEGGYTEYRCSVCGDSYKANIKSALGHSYPSDGIVTKEAIPFRAGTKAYACTRCGDIKYESYRLGFIKGCLWFITLPFRLLSRAAG